MWWPLSTNQLTESTIAALGPGRGGVGVAAPQRRPQLAQRGGAGGVGAVRNDQNRGALPGPLLDDRQRLEDCVVDRGAARRPQRGERVPHVPLLGGPAGQRPRLVVEGH